MTVLLNPFMSAPPAELPGAPTLTLVDSVFHHNTTTTYAAGASVNVHPWYSHNFTITPPDSDGGAPITTYRMRYTGIGGPHTEIGTSLSFSLVLPGGSPPQNINIAAVNIVGEGPISNVVNPMPPLYTGYGSTPGSLLYKTTGGGNNTWRLTPEAAGYLPLDLTVDVYDLMTDAHLYGPYTVYDVNTGWSVQTLTRPTSDTAPMYLRFTTAAGQSTIVPDYDYRAKFNLQQPSAPTITLLNSWDDYDWWFTNSVGWTTNNTTTRMQDLQVTGIPTSPGDRPIRYYSFYVNGVFTGNTLPAGPSNPAGTTITLAAPAGSSITAYAKTDYSASTNAGVVSNTIIGG